MKKVEKSKLACDQLEDWQSVSEVESSRVSGETALLTKKSRHNQEDMFWMMVSLCVCVSVSLRVCVQQSCVLFTGCKLPPPSQENISISALKQKSTQLPGQPKSKWKSWKIKKTFIKKKLWFCAKVSPCKIVCSCNFVPSCKSVSVQFCLRVILSPRAKVSPCNFVFVQFCLFVQFCSLVQFCLRAILSARAILTPTLLNSYSLWFEKNTTNKPF